MALLGLRLHRCFVTALPPIVCANRLRMPGKFAPPLGRSRINRVPWRPEAIGVESRVEGDAFLLAVGSPDQYEWSWLGFWVARGWLRPLQGGTLAEVRVRPRRTLGPPLVRFWFLTAPVALALLILGGVGWLPRGRVTDAVLWYAALGLLAFLFFALGYVLELVMQHRRDDLGRLIAAVLEAAEVPCGQASAGLGEHRSR